MLTSIVGSLLSTIDTKKGVPGIPMAALDAIPDENTRLVLRSIVDGINVRNGASGEGTSAFVTKGEMTGLKSGGWFGGAGASATPTPAKITPGDINRIINDLQGQVMESLLFKELGERVNLIDKPGGIFERVGATELVLRNETTQRVDGDTAISRTVSTMGTRVGQAEAAIQTETTQRVNSDNAFQNTLNTQYSSVNQNLALVQQSVTTNANNVSALSQVLNQIQAAVGSNSAAIQQEAKTRVNADGDIYAKYSVKIDVNGYVSGYGLMSTANNSTPFSEFIVRADRFAIGSPSGPGITPVIPFIVTTTWNNGNAPGVYIDNAVIKELSAYKITSGYINADRIDVNTIKAEMIISSSATSFEQVSLSCGNDVWESYSFYMHHYGYVSVIASGARTNSGTGGNYSTYVAIDNTSYNAGATGSWYSSAAPGVPTLMISKWLNEGYHTVYTKIQISTATGRHISHIAIFKSYR